MNKDYGGFANKGGIYKIVNTTNGRFYIGSAKRFKQRAREHESDLKNNHHVNPFLQHDWNKCGAAAFRFQIEKVIEGTEEERKIVEQQLLNESYDNQKICYNIAKKTESLPRSVFSNNPDITKKILSEKSKAMWANSKLRKKILKQKEAAQKTEEYRQACSEAQKKNWQGNEERKQKTSDRLREEHVSGSREHAVQVLNANQKKGRKTFKERMKTDSGFKKKYQEIGRQNIAKRNAEQPKKKYPSLLSPDGKVYEVCGVPTFCKEHGLIKQLLYNVLNGKSKSHNSWTLAN